MSWSDLMSGASDVVLSTFGASGTYHSLTHGTVEAKIVIDRDVEVMDEVGNYSRKAMATIASGLVKPQSGDWIQVGDERWSVEQLNTDDGYLTQVMIRPQL